LAGLLTLTKTQLKQRGWTNSLIKAFAPIPDKTKPNPNYRSGPPMWLFDDDRILTIEASEDFQEKKKPVEKRQASARKAIATKLSKLQKYVDEIEIEIPELSKSALIHNACNHYNQMQEEREITGRSTSGMYANINSNEKFLERICVNYLRHCLTDYEIYLSDMSCKVGFLGGYKSVRQKIFGEIAKKYQWLKDECERQQEDRLTGCGAAL
jgi:hypothetical protein